MAEWFGRNFLSLTDEERRDWAKAALGKADQLPCPFQMGTPPCSKIGGVCSLRRHTLVGNTLAELDQGPAAVAITCPRRFRQDGMIYEWIGEVLLGTKDVVNLGEMPFLERVSAQPTPEGEEPEDVGRIDNIIVVPGSSPLQWCALEVQGVYFSGMKMEPEWTAIERNPASYRLPLGRRRPDFRSSGPKRLMPQLQTKVPTLRRWGKKTAVAVDEAFFQSLGPMRVETNASSADIAWFIVASDGGSPVGGLSRVAVRFTTLEHAVEGLTAGRPVTQDVFEGKIRTRLEALRGSQAT